MKRHIVVHDTVNGASLSGCNLTRDRQYWKYDALVNSIINSADDMARWSILAWISKPLHVDFRQLMFLADSGRFYAKNSSANVSVCRKCFFTIYLILSNENFNEQFWFVCTSIRWQFYKDVDRPFFRWLFVRLYYVRF